MDKNVVILNFSPRNDGNCGQICNFIAEYYKRTNVFVYDVRLEPCGNCNYECLTSGERCPALTAEFKKLMERITASDLTYFVLPNFCGFPCANYFAFNERTVGYFNGDHNLMEAYLDADKRFVIISNSEGFESAMQQTSAEPKILYLKSGKYKLRSTDGDLLTCADAVNDLADYLGRHG